MANYKEREAWNTFDTGEVPLDDLDEDHPFCEDCGEVLEEGVCPVCEESDDEM